jgi:hypothetical protein
LSWSDVPERLSRIGRHDVQPQLDY